MSQVRTRRNITELQEVNLGRLVNITPIATVVGSAISNATNIAVDQLITGSVDLSSTTVHISNTGTVKSPVALRQSFAETFIQSLGKVSESMDTIERQKVAVVRTLSSGEYRVLTPKIVEAGIQEVLNAQSTEHLRTAVDQLMNAVQQEHNTIFTQSIAQVVEEASAALGFAQTEVKQSGSHISVHAVNVQGQSIVTEVNIDQGSSRVDLVSETFGIRDKSCDLILNQFDKELERAGLKFRKPDVKWKEIQWMPDNPLVRESNPQVSQKKQNTLKKMNNKPIKH